MRQQEQLEAYESPFQSAAFWTAILLIGEQREISHFYAQCIHISMIRKLKSGEYRLYSRKKNEATGKRRNLGTFDSLEKAKQHEREVQYFKKH
jgi:hypothetical protein